MSRPGKDQRGATATLAVTLTALLLLMALLMSVLGRVLVDHRRASAAADLAALAGAGALQAGREPCAPARRIAHDNGASLTRCAVSGEQVEVRAGVDVWAPSALLPLLGPVRVEAEARAGPVR